MTKQWPIWLVGIFSAAGLLLAAGIFAVTQPWVKPQLSRPPHVDPKRLEAHVKYLSVDLYPRSFEQIQHLATAADFIADTFKANGGDVSRQRVVVEDASYDNIIARYGPANGPVIVIGAHYDSAGDQQNGAKHPRGYSLATHTPGADDNASGVAGLLELSRLLQRYPPRQPVELVAYTLEEPPYFRTEHMGSAWHARSLIASKREVKFMLALEMIGYFDDRPNSQAYPLPGVGLLYGNAGNYVAVVGKFSDFALTRHVKAVMQGASALSVQSINAPPFLRGIDFSDHRNYWQYDIPALMITDTAFYRNPSYHRAADTYDKLDYQRMAQVVQGIFALSQE